MDGTLNFAIYNCGRILNRLVGQYYLLPIVTELLHLLLIKSRQFYVQLTVFFFRFCRQTVQNVNAQSYMIAKDSNSKKSGCLKKV